MQQEIPQQPQEKLDNISKLKSLILPLRESLSQTLKTAAQALHQNSLIDAGSTKGVDAIIPRFDKNLEEFYSICDQIELHLRTSIECVNQGASSQRYLPCPVTPTRTEPMGYQDNTITYPHYLATVRAQVSYADENRKSLTATAQNIDGS